MKLIKRVSYAALIVAGLIGTGYVAHANDHGDGHFPKPRVVAHHCVTEDDWGHVSLKSLEQDKVILKCEGGY